MSIKQKDIKLLWGRSGNRCAFCRIELSQDAKAVSSSFTLGEQAHIIGEKEEAARGKSVLSLEERNSYHNLILLCPTHHTEIDNNEIDWPTENLYLKKSNHELWVTETLSETVDHVRLAKQIILASIVDAAVNLCDLENWTGWTSWALAPDPKWDRRRPERIYEFRQKIIAAIWPEEFDEFRRAAVTLSITLHRAAHKFMEYSDLEGDSYLPFKFYKALPFNPKYAEDLIKYEKWIDECYELVYQATKSANWFADVVRRDINPMFFAESGKFIVHEGPFDDLSYRTRLIEFNADEKIGLPTSLAKNS